MEAIQKLDIPNKINETLNINATEFQTTTDTSTEKFKTYLIIFILLVFVLFLLRYFFNHIHLGQKIKRGVLDFVYNIEVGGKKFFENIKKVKSSKKKFIKDSKNTLQELEDAVNKNVKNVSTNIKDKNLVNKKMLLQKGNNVKDSLNNVKDSLNNVNLKLKERPKRITRQELQADKSTNTIQARSKTGFCYVGTDRGYRSCMEINESDKCVSNQIFPTRELCINPTLRV